MASSRRTRVEPKAPARAETTFSGPVGFALTNSTLMRRPPPVRMSNSPPSPRQMSISRSSWKSRAMRKLMKPGPAISTDSITSRPNSSLAASSPASSRGLRSRRLASIIATFVLRSPWLRSRGFSSSMATSPSKTP